MVGTYCICSCHSLALKGKPKTTYSVIQFIFFFQAWDGLLMYHALVLPEYKQKMDLQWESHLIIQMSRVSALPLFPSVPRKREEAERPFISAHTAPAAQSPVARWRGCRPRAHCWPSKVQPNPEWWTPPELGEILQMHTQHPVKCKLAGEGMGQGWAWARTLKCM